MNTDPMRVGELRTSQLLHTFGVGAIIDLPNVSVVVRGLEEWDKTNSALLKEDRLLDLVRRKVGDQVADLRTPPYTAPNANVYDEWTRVGVPVGAFPRWLRCTSCRMLASADSGAFPLLPDRYRPDRVRFVHECRGQGRKRPSAVPARFVLACESGHLDDFPWMYFVHKGVEPERGRTHTLTLTELGSSGEAANVLVMCSCGAKRSMAEAFGLDNALRNLPGCRGRHPHLGSFDGCANPTRSMLLGATNGWFPTQIRVFSLPEADTALADAVARNWTYLRPLTALSKDTAKGPITGMTFWPELDQYGYDKVWDAMRTKAGEDVPSAPKVDGDEEVDVAGPEWEAFTRPETVTLPDFTTQRTATPRKFADRLERVVLVPRLREVSALYGFTRIDAPEFDVVSTDAERVAPLSKKPPTWVPCAEQRGEGVFLKFREDPLAVWEASPAVRQREKRLEAGHERWRANRLRGASPSVGRPVRPPRRPADPPGT